LKYIVAIDIGGTTFNTGIFSESFNEIAVSDKDKIKFYSGKNHVVDGIVEQVNQLIDKNDIDRKDIKGLGIAAPGPLDPKKGRILDTPNLKIFRQYSIANDFAKKLKIDTYLENDANLFSIGEWYTQYQKSDVIVGLTLGTGLGFGLVINGKLFTGSNGMAMEYGISPFQWGLAEKNVSIGYLRRMSLERYGVEISPRELEKKYLDGDDEAIAIYNDFGENLGTVLSHVINMLDPQVITIGGGLSKAYKLFKDSMNVTIDKYCPTYSKNQIIIAPSKLRELSTMVGACIMVENKNKF
jgi:glucokinase